MYAVSVVQQTHHRFQSFVGEARVLAGQAQLQRLPQLVEAHQHPACVLEADDLLLEPLEEQRRGAPRDVLPADAVEDSLLPLVQRPALAYRSRRLLDYNTSDLARIEVQQPKEQFKVEQTNGLWRLTSPAQSELDSSKVFQLTGDLGRLEAVEYVSESAAPQPLDQTYGLAKPALTAKIVPADAKKPTQTLLIGKQNPGKTDYFAKLQANPSIFLVKKELHDAVAQDSLAYLSTELWQLNADQIKELRIRKAEPEYRLKREGPAWKISGPFEASATAQVVKQVEDEVVNLRCERYAAHSAADLKAYGLDKPYLRISVEEQEQGEPQSPRPGPCQKCTPW